MRLSFNYDASSLIQAVTKSITNISKNRLKWVICLDWRCSH